MRKREREREGGRERRETEKGGKRRERRVYYFTTFKLEWYTELKMVVTKEIQATLHNTLWYELYVSTIQFSPLKQQLSKV